MTMGAVGWLDTGGPLTWLLVATCGWALGRALAAGVGRLVEPSMAGRRLFSPLVAPLGIAVACAAWWWEVRMQGQVAVGVGGMDGPQVLVVRWAAHLVLFAFLAAASWVDLRHRVIPDAITVPGVLLGMLWIAVRPDALLPVARETPRSYAPPLVEPDVLGVCGGLGGRWPAWLVEPWSLPALVAAGAIFCCWCLVGTEPPTISPGRRRGWRDALHPRTAAAAIGGATILAAWIAGGTHWRGLVSSLAGLAVAGGIIWGTRAGASRALGREAMGLGDVTLMAMVGCWVGWQPCVLACFLAVFIGLAHGVVQVVTRSETELPFGPSLCLGVVAVVVGWRPLWNRTAEFFERPADLALVVGAVIGLTAVTLWAWHRIRPLQGV